MSRFLEELAEYKSIPKEDYVIYRYLTLEKFVHAISTNSLNFSSVLTFEDELEGIGSEKFLDFNYWLAYAKENFSKNGGKEEPYSDEEYNNLAEQMLMNANYMYNRRGHYHMSCWQIGDCENEGMWKLYAKNGICIKTTVSQLCEELKISSVDGKIYPCEVIYTDSKEINTVNFFNPLIFKRKEFEHEKELRFIKSGSGNFSFESIEWNKIINEIIYSPYMSSLTKNVFDTIIDTYSPNLKSAVKTSNLTPKKINVSSDIFELFDLGNKPENSKWVLFKDINDAQHLCSFIDSHLKFPWIGRRVGMLTINKNSFFTERWANIKKAVYKKDMKEYYYVTVTDNILKIPGISDLVEKIICNYTDLEKHKSV